MRTAFAGPWLIGGTAALGLALDAAGCFASAPGGPTGAPGARVVLRVAAAASVGPALEDLARAFEKDRPETEVRVTAGATGNLAAQAREGAPFDMFFAADTESVDLLARDNLIRADGGPFLYARGRLALAARLDSPVDVAALGAAALDAPGFSRLAIANPRHAPYGRAAVEALTALGLWERYRDRLVMGENAAQTAQFLDAGAADAALTARSAFFSPSGPARARLWTVPEQWHAPLPHAGATLARCAAPDRARAFVDFLRGPAGAAALARHGLDPSP
ncbi:MAG: molybdate ABC transporter substrate-binding protein [Planctomycetes bacterium]|nr:molybdate ABC transporter substrate-binding protein [Planctomycetota bacterium]